MEGGLCVQSMGNQVMDLLNGDCKLPEVLLKDLKSWKSMNSPVQTVCLEVHSGGCGTRVCSPFQVECHPYLAQNELIAHCQARGLEVTAYSPLGSSDRAWRHPSEPVLLEDPVVLALAEKHGRSPAQILLRYGTFLR